MAIGILLAAGMGTRMRPLTETTPKPLLKAGDTMLIETVIKSLETQGVSDIYVITGYLAEQFDILPKLYPKVSLIHNPEYDIKNNLTSLYVVADKLRGEDCFICEADLYIKSTNILSECLSGGICPHLSGYFGKLVPGHSDDWVFDLDEAGIITRVGKTGTDAYNMVGLSFLKKSDSTILADEIIKAYQTPGTEEFFWDDVVNRNLDKLKLTVFPVGSDDIYEVDTPEELASLQA